MQMRRIKHIHCFFRHLRDRHGLFLQTRAQLRRVFKLVEIPCVIPFLSLACSLVQSCSTTYQSQTRPCCYSIVISNLIGPRLYPSRSRSASMWGHVPTLSSLYKSSRCDCHWALEIGERISDATTMTVNARGSPSVGHGGLCHATVTAWTRASFQGLRWGSRRLL